MTYFKRTRWFNWNIDFGYFQITSSLLILFTESTQLEDPRQEWREIQEAMLREYLLTAQDVLEVRLFQ